MSSAGLSRASLGIGLIGVGVIKTAVGFGGFSGELLLSSMSRASFLVPLTYIGMIRS